jgi:hypothetical protein
MSRDAHNIVELERALHNVALAQRETLRRRLEVGKHLGARQSASLLQLGAVDEAVALQQLVRERDVGRAAQSAMY